MGTYLAEREMIRAADRHAEELYAAGKSIKEVVASLEARQLSADDACEVAHRVHRLRGARLGEQASKKKAGRTKMVLGALLCLAGIIVTVGSYLAAGSGGSCILAWGAILFGALLFLWGWEQARRRE